MVSKSSFVPSLVQLPLADTNDLTEYSYERIISRIRQTRSPAEWKIAQKLLGWMVCARRPLKWHEIQAAVSMEPINQTIDFDERRLRVHIKDLCGSLIQVLPEDRIELVHSTAK